MKTLSIYVDKQFTCFFSQHKPSVYLWRKCFCAKNHLYIQFTQHLSLQVYNNNRRSISQPCNLYPALWDKQDAMDKDSNYKQATWKEIAEILHLNKEDVIKKWTSLRDTFVGHKNIKSKSGDGLSQCKPKWKCYDIMSFIDITLLKQRYVPIYLTTSYIQHTYIQ